MLPAVRVLLGITEPQLQRLNVAAGTKKYRAFLATPIESPLFPLSLGGLELPWLSTNLNFS